jgi:2-oxoglutarate ferredoxin oxidoreductase subunit beta
MNDLKTQAEVTWCPGCGNTEILNSALAVIGEIIAEGFPREKIIIVSGIGNHAKIVDYLQLNSFNSLHGRGIPAAEAIKIADPDCKVICFAGDGDTYAEGLEHLIFAAKRNIDITVILHNNRTYGLATGQFTPTSQTDLKGSTMPFGAKENAFNPLELLISSGATYIARGYPPKKEHFRKLMKEAILHRGFAFLDVLQVCVTFNNLYAFYNKHVVEADTFDPTSRQQALESITAWDYRSLDGPIPIGRFYAVSLPTHEGNYPARKVEQHQRETVLNELWIKMK